MLKKIKLYRPIIFVLAVALLLCTCTAVCDALLRGYSLPAAYIVSGITLVALIVSAVLLRRAGKDEARYIAKIGDGITNLQSDTLITFPLPIIAVNGGEIVWYNDHAKTDVLAGCDWHGKNIVALFGEEKPRQKMFDAAVGEALYTVYPVCGDGEAPLVLYYMVDDTVWKKTAAQFEKTRPAIFIISVDNYSELQRYGRKNEQTQLLAQIERYIEDFVGENNGILIKTERSRYVAMIEEQYMDDIVEKRFPLLDRVRALSVDSENLSVTLSVGLARKCTSFPEGEQIARQALEMAQGRGGDQVAVKTKSGYDFYGGISKGVERRTKVKTRIIATAMRELICSSDLVVLMGHKFGDYDSLGAAVGLLHAVRQMGKPGIIAVNRSQNLVPELIAKLEANGYDNSFYNPAEVLTAVHAAKNPLLIIVDTHLENVLESAEVYHACRNVVIIDHHRRMVGYIDNGVIFYHEPYASSACEMVTELVQYFGEDVSITRWEAEALLAGIMLDTKNFVLKTGVRTFEAAAYLRRQGADTVEVRQFFATSIRDYRERSGLVSHAEIVGNCAIAQTDSDIEDIRVVSSQAADELLGISGVDASFVLFQSGTQACISARSMGKINVQVIMESLGGGGHQTMAAAQLEGVSLPDARERLLAAIREATVPATGVGT